MSVLSDNLRRLRAEKGLSLTQMAGEIHKSPSVFNTYENGTSQPPINTLIDLCYLFHTTPNDLLGFTGGNQSSDTTTSNNIGDYIEHDLGLKIINDGKTTSIVGNGYLYRGSITLQKIYETAYQLQDKHKQQLVHELITELKAWSYDNEQTSRKKVISVSRDELLSLVEAITNKQLNNN